MKLRYKGITCSWIQNRIFRVKLAVALVAFAGFEILLLAGEIVALLIWVMFALYFLIGLGFLTYKMDVRIKANETSLSFRALRGKKAIRYSEINSIGFTREVTRNGGIRFVEKICIRLEGDEEIWIAKPMDDVDLNEIAEKPELLTKKFDDSSFQELMHYIECRMPIMAG